MSTGDRAHEVYTSWVRTKIKDHAARILQTAISEWWDRQKRCGWISPPGTYLFERETYKPIGKSRQFRQELEWNRQWLLRFEAGVATEPRFPRKARPIKQRPPSRSSNRFSSCYAFFDPLYRSLAYFNFSVDNWNQPCFRSDDDPDSDDVPPVLDLFINDLDDEARA